MAGEITIERPPLTPEMLLPVKEYQEKGQYFYLEATEELLA